MRSSREFLRGSGDLVIPAHSAVSLLVDNRELVLGYPVLITDGGAGASATLTYAEALFDAAGRKGNRNEIEGKTIRGRYVTGCASTVEINPEGWNAVGFRNGRKLFVR